MQFASVLPELQKGNAETTNSAVLRKRIEASELAEDFF